MGNKTQAIFNKGRQDGYKGKPMSLPDKLADIYEAGYFVGQQEKKKENKQ